MTTSGSVDFDQTRNEIINDALVLCGAIAAGASPAAEDTTYAARQLNRMVKSWQADGVRLWTRREFYLFLQLSQGRYQLGGAATEHIAAIEDTVRTYLASAGSSGDGTIEVNSATGIAASDNIGIVLDDLTIQWTTVSSISSTTVTLGASLTGAAAANNAVFAYTTVLGRPMKVIGAARTDTSDVDVPIPTISHDQYHRIPNKTITGKTNEVYYQPEHPSGFAYLWPEPETAADRLRLTGLFPIEDFDTSANTPDLPQEWLDCLVWNLSARLAPSYGTKRDRKVDINAGAAALYAQMSGWDMEPESVLMQPDFEMG